MNFSSYPLYVGNDIDKKEFDGYGDWVELKSDSKNPSWSVSDESIIRLKDGLCSCFCSIRGRKKRGLPNICNR